MVFYGDLIKYQGHAYLRQRLVLSILSGKPVRIDRIRSEDKDLGLRGIWFSSTFVRALLTRCKIRRFWSKLAAASGKGHKWHGDRDILYGCVSYCWTTVGTRLKFITGTSILVKPGVIIGGQITHECPLTRSVGYFLEPLIMLAPFAKKPMNITLRGVTTDDKDLSVSTLSSI